VLLDSYQDSVTTPQQASALKEIQAAPEPVTTQPQPLVFLVVQPCPPPPSPPPLSSMCLGCEVQQSTYLAALTRVYKPTHVANLSKPCTATCSHKQQPSTYLAGLFKPSFVAGLLQHQRFESLMSLLMEEHQQRSQPQARSRPLHTEADLLALLLTGQLLRQVQAGSVNKAPATEGDLVGAPGDWGPAQPHLCQCSGPLLSV
jgi:hypothetical protein